MEGMSTSSDQTKAGFLDNPRTPHPDTMHTIAIDAITVDFLEEPGGTYADAMKGNLRDLGGEEDISLVSEDEKDHLPIFQDPREHHCTGSSATCPW
jgi:hypothetical protein